MTNYRNFGEGHLWPLASSLLDIIDRYEVNNVIQVTKSGENRSIMNFENEKKLLIEAFRSLFNVDNSHFIDKTPGSPMIRCSPLLKKIYPDAMFIFTHRHPVGTITSKMRKFRNVDFVDHCRDWRDCQVGWESVKREISGSWIEVAHHDIVTRPRKVAASLSEALSFPAQLGELFVDEINENKYVERTSIDYVSDDEVEFPAEWTASEKLIYEQICGSLAEKQSYFILGSGNSGRKQKKSEVALFFPQGPNDVIRVENTNSYCYGTAFGFQLCPNLPDAGPVAYMIRCNKEIMRPYLIMQARKEFENGPDVAININVVDRHSQTTTFVMAISINDKTPIDVIVDLREFPIEIDIVMSIMLMGASTNSYATIHFHRPVLSMQANR